MVSPLHGKEVNVGEPKERNLLTVSSRSTSGRLELGGIKEESIRVCKIH